MNSYSPPPWLPGSHPQTAYPALFLGHTAPACRREPWDTPDGDFIDLDWLDGPPDKPWVALFHGLEGNSRSHYAVALMAALRRRGWSGVVPHFRGCSGRPNRLPRAYHSGDSAEIGWILRRLKTLAGPRPLFAMGISLGGNALLKWLGETAEQAGNTVQGAAAVCPPVDVRVSAENFEAGLGPLYARHFLRTLKPKSLEKLRRFPGLYDARAVARARTFREFDELVTAPLHGFSGALDYWTRASSKPWLPRIRIPTLLLHTRNDPFFPAGHLPQPGEVSSQVVLDIQPEGGHVGFVTGPFPGRLQWLPERILNFFTQI